MIIFTSHAPGLILDLEPKLHLTDAGATCRRLPSMSHATTEIQFRLIITLCLTRMNYEGSGRIRRNISNSKCSQHTRPFWVNKSFVES